MAKGNFSACQRETERHEGGWSDHPKDPGGATMKGITLARFRVYHPKATKTDLRNISNAEVERIYHNDYWIKVRGDDLPYGVDLATYDFGVNSGPSRAVRYLQSVLGVAQDGLPSPGTLRAAGSANGKTVIQKLCAKRLGFLQGLGTWATFKRGWSRRVAEVEARAVTMWLSQGGSLTKQGRQALEAEAGRAKETAKKQDSGAVATGGIGGGTGTVAASGDVNWWLIGLLALVAAGVVGFLVLKAGQNKQRAKAYAAAAAR